MVHRKPGALGACVLMAASGMLGGASLLAMAAFLCIGSFDVFDPEWAWVSALAWNGGMSLAFFLQHSGMIRGWVRLHLLSVVPDAFAGAVFSIASGSVLLAVLGLWQRVPPEIVTVQGSGRWALRVASALALAGFVWGVHSLNRFDALGIRAIRAHRRGGKGREASGPLVARGPYRWVRHPLYAFTLVLIWTCPDVTVDRLLFNVLWSGWIVLAVRLEERDLEALYGEEYRRYRRAVPMLIPRRIRHPMYTGFLLWILGWVLAHGAAVSLAPGVAGDASILYWQRLEEAAVEKRFGDLYRTYRQATWF